MMTDEVKHAFTPTGKMNAKRIQAFFSKQDVVTVNRVPGQQAFYLANRFLIVKVQDHPDLYPYNLFDKDSLGAKFLKGRGIEPCSNEIEELWNRLEEPIAFFAPLALTQHLFEQAQARNKPGKLLRKLTLESDEHAKERNIWVEKSWCDSLLTPGIEELKEFKFELVQRVVIGLAIRVIGSDGTVAYLKDYDPVELRTPDQWK